MLMECIELNLLCKHMKKSQKQQSNHSSTELSKTQFPVSIIKKPFVH